MKFDLDPTPQRVVCIAILEFLAAVITGILLILQSGNMPTDVQMLIIVLAALLQLVLFLLAFVKGEDVKETTHK